MVNINQKEEGCLTEVKHSLTLDYKDLQELTRLLDDVDHDEHPIAKDISNSIINYLCEREEDND